MLGNYLYQSYLSLLNGQNYMVHLEYKAKTNKVQKKKREKRIEN